MRTGRTAAGLWKDLELPQAEARVQGPLRARRKGNRQRCPFLEMLVKKEEGGPWAGGKPDQIDLWRPCGKGPQVISRLLFWMVKLGPFRSPDCLRIISFMDRIQGQI